MNCAFDKEKLSAFYDGELAAGEKAEVERHIASCSECLRDLGELKSAALLIKELPRLRAPKSIAEGVAREIQAAGKVHVMARFRRGILWASAMAAGLFIVANAMYFTGARSAAPAPEGAMATSLAKSQPPAAPPPRRESAAKDAPAELQEADRADRRQDELRKRTVELDAKQEAARPADAFAEAGKKNSANESEKLAAGKEAPAKAAEPKPAVPDAAPPPVTAPPPAKPAAAPAPMAKAEGKSAAETPAEKTFERKLDAVVAKPEPDLKAKVASAGPSAADLPPLQYSCVTTQIAKARPRLDESLKKLGVAPVPPPPSSFKAPRNREAENTVVVELTDAQLLKLREELEKPGDLRLVAGTANTVEPVLPGFRSGGLYGNKAVAGGAGTKAAPVAPAKDKDGKELEDKNSTDPAAPAAAEPRRRVTLHLVEAKTLPAPEPDVAPAKKN